MFDNIFHIATQKWWMIKLNVLQAYKGTENDSFTIKIYVAYKRHEKLVVS